MLVIVLSSCYKGGRSLVQGLSLHPGKIDVVITSVMIALVYTYINIIGAFLSYFVLDKRGQMPSNIFRSDELLPSLYIHFLSIHDLHFNLAFKNSWPKISRMFIGWSFAKFFFLAAQKIIISARYR